jgi:hypothetical protein
MGQAGQHQEPGQPAEAAPAGRGGEARRRGDSPKEIERSKTGTDGRIDGFRMIEITARGTTTPRLSRPMSA